MTTEERSARIKKGLEKKRRSEAMIAAHARKKAKQGIVKVDNTVSAKEKLEKLRAITLSSNADLTREHPIIGDNFREENQKLHERVKFLELRVKDQSQKLQHLQSLVTAIHNITNSMSNI